VLITIFFYLVIFLKVFFKKYIKIFFIFNISVLKLYKNIKTINLNFFQPKYIFKTYPNIISIEILKNFHVHYFGSWAFFPTSYTCSPGAAKGSAPVKVNYRGTSFDCLVLAYKVVLYNIRIGLYFKNIFKNIYFFYLF